ATGEVVDAETLGGGKMHSSISGVTDHLAENDAHALAITREIVKHLGEPPAPRKTPAKPRPPAYPIEEIYGIVSRDAKVPTDNREVLARLLDGSEFHEFKPLYGDTLMTGWGYIHGHEVGVLANNGVLFVESALKAAHLINLCVQRDIPLLFLADVNGFMAGREAEQAGIAKAGAKMISAMACARAEIHRDSRRLLRGGLSRHARPTLSAGRHVHLAKRPGGDHGPGTGRERPGPGARPDQRARRQKLDTGGGGGL